MNESAKNSALGLLIEPDPIGYSFNTPGWYIVMGIILLAMVVFAIYQYRKYLKNAYRRNALVQIENMAKRNEAGLAFEINRMLKILAIQLFGRERVAALCGKEWFVFLHSTMKSEEEPDFDAFAQAIYNSDYVLSDTQKTQLIDFSTSWVKKHDVKNV